MKNAIIYWFVFLAVQIIAGGIIQGIYLLWKGPGAVMDATGTILTMTLFSVAIVALFLWQKWAVVVCVGCLGSYYPFRMASGTDA